MVRRVLQTKTTPMEESQRNKIFMTRCVVKERLCNVIVDSGSCTNVMSTYLIDKLNHPTYDHPSPYKLQWLENKIDVEITKQALILFKIGKYEDSVMCDVCPMEYMEDCHILLGKPYHDDRFAKYNGRFNMYRIKSPDKQ